MAEEASDKFKAEVKKVKKAIDEGYAGFLVGGEIVDAREHPEARPAPGDAGRNVKNDMGSK